MSHPSALSGVFARPFPEQVAFFRNKLGNLVPTQRWDDLQGAAHDTGFMVAGAMQADLLTDLATAVDKAIAQGRGIEDFRKDFRAIVAKNGWTGWTGEGSVKGEAWRVRTIYRTNTYTSYAAGRYAQLLEGNFPFWVYRHGGSLEPRPMHLSLDGIALPPDHPFWAKYYPPSDWGCSCYAVGARSTAAVKRLGGDPAKQLPANWSAINPKTGAPVGIGRGWDYAPGAGVADTVRALASKIGSWDYRVAKAFMEKVPEAQRDAMATAYRTLPTTADDTRRFAQTVASDRADPEAGRTIGLLTSVQSARASQTKGIHADGFDFSLTPNEVSHALIEHGNDAKEREQGQRAIGPDDFARLPMILNGSTPRYAGVSRRHHAPVFEMTLSIDGEKFVTRWEYWTKRRTMTLLTFFIKTGERA